MAESVRPSSFDTKSIVFRMRKSRKEALCTGEVQILFAAPVKPIAWQTLASGTTRFVKDYDRRGYFIEVSNI